MKLFCPKCDREISRESTYIMQTKMFCLGCDEPVSIEASFRAKESLITLQIKPELAIRTKPTNSRILEIRMDDGATKLIFLRRKSVFSVIWITFWLGSLSPFIIPPAIQVINLIVSPGGIARITALVEALINIGIEKLLLSFIFILFFVLIFSFPALSYIAILSVKSSLAIDEQSIELTRNLWGIKSTHKISNQAGIRVIKKVRYCENGDCVYGAGISNKKRQRITVGLYLTDGEIAWIDYLIQTARQGPSSESKV
jgi:hypothetical protein